MPFFIPFLPYLSFVPFATVSSCALALAAVKRGRRRSPRPISEPVAGPRSAPQPKPLRALTDFLLAGPRGEEEAKAQTDLQRASIGFGFALGGLYFPPLQIAGVLFVVPVIVHFYKAGYNSLSKDLRVNADVLTAVMLTGALAGRFFSTLNLGAWFLVFVRWLALKTESHSRQQTIDLFGQRARSAWMVIDGVDVETPVDNIRVGDVIAVHAGQIVPLDGVIVEGSASVDQRMLTGEAQPADRGVGDSVFAATVALSGRILIRVERAGEATTAAEIGRILTNTDDYKASLVSRAHAFNDRMALPFLVLSAAAAPFIGLSSSLGLLQATPGWRMLLYGPMSMLTYLQLAAHSGILIKDGRSLELLQDVDTVVFDKTGTLTVDQPRVRSIHACPGFSPETILAYAAVAESKQTHPIAKAILEEAADRGIQTAPSEDLEYEVGYGISVKYQGASVRVGSARYMELNGIGAPVEILALMERIHLTGDSLILVAAGHSIAGAIVLQPTIRQEAQAVVAQLRARGLRLYLMSGDHDAPTKTLAQRLNLDGYFAEVLPTGKADLVKRLQNEGRNVCFIGDGINDSIALKSANVSVSLHGASTIAVDTAQIVFMSGNLVRLPRLFELAHEFRANMQVNFMAATAPSALIIAGALFFGLGFTASVILYQISIPFALYNSVRPLLLAERAPRAA